MFTVTFWLIINVSSAVEAVTSSYVADSPLASNVTVEFGRLMSKLLLEVVSDEADIFTDFDTEALSDSP